MSASIRPPKGSTNRTRALFHLANADRSARRALIALQRENNGLYYSVGEIISKLRRIREAV